MSSSWAPSNIFEHSVNIVEQLLNVNYWAWYWGNGDECDCGERQQSQSLPSALHSFLVNKITQVWLDPYVFLSSATLVIIQVFGMLGSSINQVRIHLVHPNLSLTRVIESCFSFCRCDKYHDQKWVRRVGDLFQRAGRSPSLTKDRTGTQGLEGRPACHYTQQSLWLGSSLMAKEAEQKPWRKASCCSWIGRFLLN